LLLGFDWRIFAQLILDLMLLNIPLPTWVPILFFVLLLIGSFIVGRWLERNDNSPRFEDWPPQDGGHEHHH